MDQTSRIFKDGEVIDSTYEIRGLLGSGGMGEVYEAYDVKLERPAAIKASLPDLDARLLIAEAKALAMFNHPSVVTVYGIGSHNDSEYIALERLHGASLFAHLAGRRGTPFTIDEVLDISLALADGLGLVHRAGIAHRDLKPANIILAPGNRVVLLDFGLVLSEADKRTAQDPCGTPQYMAPETVSDRVTPGNRRLVDLYALGTIMYEMLSGAVPFAGYDADETMKRQVSDPVPRVRDKRPDVPDDLDDLVVALTDKSPAARPQTAEAVAWSLRQVRQQSRSGSDNALSVLIVDDEAYSVRALELYVRAVAPHATIRTARDGEEGLQKARESIPDLLLVDLHMPRLNGVELAMALRGTHLFDACRIVALSARAQADDLRLLRDLGITDFIPKTSQTRAQIEALLQDVHRERTKRWWARAPASASKPR